MPQPSSGAPIEVFWMPHCSSCMAVKKFLDDRGVAYTSINVVEDKAAMTRLAALGARSVPVVVQGERFIFAQYLRDVSAFLELDKVSVEALDRVALAARLLPLLEITLKVIERTPEATLAQNLPGRDRSYFVVAHHVFQIAAAARRGIPDGRLHDRDSLQEPPQEMATREALLIFARWVLANVRDWPLELAHHSETDAVVTDYGPRKLGEVLHRVVSHAAQHARQLATWAQAQNVILDQEFNPAILDGLTVADEAFDRQLAVGQR
jgi:glutaredoxin